SVYTILWRQAVTRYAYAAFHAGIGKASRPTMAVARSLSPKWHVTASAYGGRRTCKADRPKNPDATLSKSWTPHLVSEWPGVNDGASQLYINDEETHHDDATGRSTLFQACRRRH